MRTTVSIASCLFFGAATCAVAQPAPSAASAPRIYAVVTYLQVPFEKAAQYEELAKTQTSKVMKARAADGSVLVWMETKMLLPRGTDAKYNYVTATLHGSVPPLDRPRADIDKEWSKAGLNFGSYMDRMNSLGVVLVKRELWRSLESIGSFDAGDLIRIDTKKVSQAADYVNNERTFYKPFWGQRIEIGAVKGWGLYAVALPGGEDRPYSFVTVQSFKDENQMLGPSKVPAAESWAKAAPGKDMATIYKNAAAAGHTATTELGRVQLVVRAGQGSGAGSQ